MIKVIDAGSFNFPDAGSQLIKVARAGLRGYDLATFIKRAGHQAAAIFNTLKFASDEVPVHLLAVGATEDYGPNRNGDGFTRYTCENSHDTFAKFARFYRAHLNKDPAKSYGLVKASLYNPEMKRIELICALNATKASALRNGGLMADKELEKLASGDDIPVSMACKVAYDVCSGCGNRAKSPKEYCRSEAEGGTCKYGGLKTAMGTVYEDGHILHADNPNPFFFDISHVYRPADRIAYVSGQLKAASAGCVSGASLAESLGLTLPPLLLVTDEMLPNVAQQVKLAAMLADVERDDDERQKHYAIAFAPEVQPPMSDPGYKPADDPVKFAQHLRAMADQRIVLSLTDFISLTTGMPHEKAAYVAEATKAAMPGVFDRLLLDTESISANPYVPSKTSTDALRMWAAKEASSRSLLPRYVDSRLKLATLRAVPAPQPLDRELVKTASNDPKVAEMAKHYALYKLAFLAAISDDDRDSALTASLCLVQNSV